MAGFYDNETEKYIFNPALLKGDWFEDNDGFLYIIPTDDGEIDGPDTCIMDALNKLCRENGKVTDRDAECLELTRVDEVLKRFSEEEGFYHA
jgi:hypothetical protein